MSVTSRTDDWRGQFGIFELLQINLIFRPSGCRSGCRGGLKEYEAFVMRKLVKKGCVLLSLSVAFQFFGCLSIGATRDFLIDGVKHAGLEFLLDNNGIIDLFVDS